MSDVKININPIAKADESPKDNVDLQDQYEKELRSRELYNSLWNCLICFICTGIIVAILMAILCTKH